MIARGAKGLFLEVPTDDPAQVANAGPPQGEQEPAQVLRAVRRPADHRHPLRPADPPRQAARAPAPLRPARPRRAARRRGGQAGHRGDPDPPLQLRARLRLRPPGRRLGQGFDPVKIRKPIYASPEEKKYKIPRRLHPLKVFCSARHALHHVRERGYVERPARVDVILKALEELPDVERLPVRNFGEGPIRAVHDADFVNYVRDYLPGAARGRAGLPLRLPDPADRPAAPRPQASGSAITASTRSRP